MKVKHFACAEISKIDVNCKLFRIQVEESSNDNVEISWCDTAMRSLDIKQGKDRLTVRDHATIGTLGALALINLKKDALLQIKLPSSYAGKAVFQSRDESIHISDLTCRATIGISASPGEVILDRVRCENLDIRGNHGKISCCRVDATDTIRISSRRGDILCVLSGKEAEYTVSYTTGSRRRISDEVSGHGSKRVFLCSERGEIAFSFQGKITLDKPASRYDRRNSFREW